MLTIDMFIHLYGFTKIKNSTAFVWICKIKICILNFIASLKIKKLLYEIILTLLQKMASKKYL